MLGGDRHSHRPAVVRARYRHRPRAGHGQPPGVPVLGDALHHPRGSGQPQAVRRQRRSPPRGVHRRSPSAAARRRTRRSGWGVDRRPGPVPGTDAAQRPRGPAAVTSGSRSADGWRPMLERPPSSPSTSRWATTSPARSAASSSTSTPSGPRRSPRWPSSSAWASTCGPGRRPGCPGGCSCSGSSSSVRSANQVEDEPRAQVPPGRAARRRASSCSCWCADWLEIFPGLFHNTDYSPVAQRGRQPDLRPRASWCSS